MSDRARVLERNQALIETAETRAGRQVATAYNRARREVLDRMLQQWAQLQGGEPMTPVRTVELVRQANLIQAIDGRLSQLEREQGQALRGIIVSSSELALEQIERELATLPKEIREGMRAFSSIDTAMVERFLPIAMADLKAALNYVGLTIDRELQAGLIQGESFPDLIKRLLGATADDPSIWKRGRTSAELGTRRTVIHANNAARVDYLRQARAGIPGLQKQVVAVIQATTTQCCLRAHGQIQDLEDPFVLTGLPRFADKMQHTPFHWNCRTAIAAYHPVFERGGLTTANMKMSAAAELRRRG